MNIKINRKSLADALAEVSPFAPQKSPVAILKFAKVTVKGGRVKIEANDTFASVRKYVDALETDGDGSFLVDCDAIAKFTAKCKGETLELSIDDETVAVKHQKGKAEFQSMKVAEYPDFDMPGDGVTEVTVPASMLAECINTAKGFVGTDDLRPQMKPIYAYVKDGEFGYCATDTRKMVNDHNPVDGADGIDAHWYIEPNVFTSLSKLCRDSDVAAIRITPTHVSYRIGDTVVQTLQTKGNYPAFERVIPNSWGMECAVDRSEVMDSLNRAVLFCDGSRLVKLDISRIDMSISAGNVQDMKFSSETVSHNGCNGEIKIGMHADYLSTCLGACTSDEVVLRMTDASRQVMIHQPGKPNMTVLLMPMMIQNI